MPNRYAICLCVDRRMLVPALFMADAIRARSAHSANPADIIIFAEAADASDAERNWMNERGVQLRDDLEMSRFEGFAILQDRLSVATLVKLVLAEHLASTYDKILYLDADISIHDDVTALFALDTGEFALAALPVGRRWPPWLKGEETRFREQARALGMTEPYRFINTGVMLIDVAKWNKSELGARALDFIGRNAELCRLPDEDALNAILDGRQAEISPIWNMSPSVWRNATVRATVQPAIIHYAGPDKPWKKYGDYKRLGHSRQAYRLYEQFLQGSPWPEWLDEQWNWRDFYKNVHYELRLANRRIRGRRNAPLSRREEQADAESFRSYCCVASFADIDQGIATREGGQLRLKNRRIAT
jgi:lipopolysaccharide biosynthesis glycosyltransferase